MGSMLKEKHEQMARLMAAGMTARCAHKLAGMSGRGSSASGLAQRPEFQKRLAELQGITPECESLPSPATAEWVQAFCEAVDRGNDAACRVIADVIIDEMSSGDDDERDADRGGIAALIF